MTPQQIQQFKTQAKAMGKSDTQINAFIQAKQQEATTGLFSPRTSPQEGELFSPRTQPEEKKDGFVKSVVKGITNPFLKLGATAQSLSTSKYLGGKGTDNSVKKTPLGEVKPITTAKEAAGVGLELGSLAVGGGGVKAGALVGGMSSLGSSLQKDKSFGDTVKDTALGAGVGGLFGAAIAPLSKALSKGLKSSAETSYSKALGATTRQNKELSDKIVPELIKRKTVSLTRGSLMNKAQSGMETSGDALEQAYNQLPEGTRVNVKPVFDRLQNLKQKYVVQGTNKIGDDVGYKAVEDMQRKLLDITDESVSVGSIRSFRQILDKATNRTGKSFALGDTDTAVAEARKAAANAIRSQLAAEHPNIAKINNEFNFWSNVNKVIGSTIQRTKSQNSLSNELAGDTGAIVGASVKGTVGSVILGAVTLKFLKQAVQSTGWRTTSALIKSSLANSLAKGDSNTANILLQKIIDASRNR